MEGEFKTAIKELVRTKANEVVTMTFVGPAAMIFSLNSQTKIKHCCSTQEMMLKGLFMLNRMRVY